MAEISREEIQRMSRRFKELAIRIKQGQEPELVEKIKASLENRSLIKPWSGTPNEIYERWVSETLES